MNRLAGRYRWAIAAGLATLMLCDAALLLVPDSWREIMRDTGVDLVLALGRRLVGEAPSSHGPPVVVIDIDRRSLAKIGPWPWPREKLANLAEVVGAAKPAVMVLDILLSEPDERSPAALARRLAGVTGRPDLDALAQTLPDGDARLKKAFEALPVVLGFVLDPEPSGSVPTAPVLLHGALPFSSLWREAGALGPPPSLAATASGIGALSLPASADGVIRRVPLFVGAGERLAPGLGLEAVRVLRRAPRYELWSDPPRLQLGEVRLPLPGDGLLRLGPINNLHAARTISAADLLEGAPGRERLADAIAIIGGSAPELGGLRQTPDDPLTPDAQIQADAIDLLLAGRVLRPLRSETLVTLGLVNGLGLLLLVAGAALSPPISTLALGLALGLLWALAVALSLGADRLLDPLTPSACAAAIFAVSSLSSFAITYRREALVRRRFEQHLAPEVVRRIVDKPDLVKLTGERREVTALFTDVEGFTSMTHRADPERLLSLLDDYFEGCAAIVIEHGGMVDKIVGDAIHALFNVPLDLPEHPRRAVECAIALRRYSTTFRQGKLADSLGFGRTRIGIETGEAIVGDVGIRTKLDYTAHGDAVNAAARLEAANKDIGSTICIGPQAASRCDPLLLRPLGSIALRGREGCYPVFEPWAEQAPAWRERYLAAFALIDRDKVGATELLERLAAEMPEDPVPRIMAARLRVEAGT
jgi:adenylate cyclase